MTASGLKNGLRAAAFVAAGFAMSAAAAAETVKIGMVNSLTGPHASFDLPASEGVLMAFDEINKKGGITVNGKPIAKGWVSIFDGKTLKGWVYEKGYWKVQDGAIVGDKGGSTPHHHYMFSDKDYSTFQ